MSLREGRNCWRRVRADRLAFLVDADAYYRRLADALERAERSVMILGWDVHSRTRLRQDEAPERSELAALLNRLVRRRRRLRVHVLGWDYALLYATERELPGLYRFSWGTHRHVVLELDGRHPIGACHHQKIVVIDDRLAFVGGMDLTLRRWDTPEHVPGDPARVDPQGRPYGPSHDVQVAVAGPAAEALGRIARERWRSATGRRLFAPRTTNDPWPAELASDLEGVEVGIARTQPAYGEAPEAREVERLYLDAIAAAHGSIYIENQYLTSRVVGEALARSLRRRDGPHVVVVLSLESSGWLEEATMWVLRARLLRELREADHAGRLYVYSPRRADQPITMHSKLCVVDDRMLTAGSANLSNRSMGLDTECNVAVWPEEEAAGARRGVAELRDRLLGEHLGVAPRRIREELERRGGRLGHVVEALRGGERTLEPLEGRAVEWLDAVVPQIEALDPERPVQLSTFLERFAGALGLRRETS
jgi:phosphatidylserine/phosphatidylglycerophosphate/cardiolipin synthase-like enzyme